jgi:hypothetical protein
VRSLFFIQRAIPMTTSNSVAPVSYPVMDLIEMSVRRCGQLPGRLSAEEVSDIKNELQMMLNSMIQEGTLLWTIDKQIYGLNLNQNLLQFSQDTIDLENVLYRFNNLPSGGLPASSAGGTAANAFDQSLTTACVQTAPDGNISYNFLTMTTIVTVGLLANATGDLNPVYEYSLDGTTWVESVPAAGVSTFTVGQWYWQDVSAPQAAQYYRVRETSGGTLNVTELVFGTSCNEIIISRLNKDDYQNLPYKNQIGRPLQYWFDRQIIPQAWIWPASQYSFNSLVVWRRRVLQNVGNFSNTIEMPPRALDTVLYSLAARIIYILPGADLSRAPILEAKATEARQLMWTNERDHSDFFLGYQISGYTGGGYGGSGNNGYR